MADKRAKHKICFGLEDGKVKLVQLGQLKNNKFATCYNSNNAESYTVHTCLFFRFFLAITS